MPKILCFGEILLRYAPDPAGNWLKHAEMPVYLGGAELNVAGALAKWGLPVAYCTAAPANFMGDQLVSAVAAKHIDTSAIHRSGNRIGTYYLEAGADVKNAGIVYDRAGSAFADLQPGMIDWNTVLADVGWFHFSAICPALSQQVAVVCEEALQAAKLRGITISIDLNYRAKLWQYGKRPIDIMPTLVSYCDIIMGNVWAGETMLGISIASDILLRASDDYYHDQANKSATEIQRRYPSVRAVANTWRFDRGGIGYFTSLFTEAKSYRSTRYETEQVIDRVGSGDCFMAGLIYGFSSQWAPQELLEFATAAAFQKLFIKGDATDRTVADVKEYLATHGKKGIYPATGH